MDRLKKALDDNHVNHSEKSFDSEKGIQSLGENPFVRRNNGDIYFMHA